MDIKIKRFDKSLPLPEYKTAGAVCVDLYVREDTVINSNEVGYIPLNIAVEVPLGYWTMVVPRSSMHKLGIMAANSVGIIDQDYAGNDDEIKLIAYNFKKEKVLIEKGMRIAQMMVLKHEKMNLLEVSSMKNKNRGGIGSTN